MKLIFGEMSVILLKGSRVSSDKIIKKGFNFKYENLNMALRNILKTDNK
jgi:NAD dependent epimerase/dehydratase family enzyme